MVVRMCGVELDSWRAMNTGHDGSLTTIHASSAPDAITRVETMVAMAGLNLPGPALRYYITSALDVIIQLTRLSDGSRKVTSFQEVRKVSDGDCLQEIFRFEQTHVDEHGKVHGIFKATGIHAKCVEKFPALGIDISQDLFDSSNTYAC